MITFWYRVFYWMCRIGLFFWHPVFHVIGRDLVPAGFSDTAENFKGLACRVVCRRVYDFPDARHVRGISGF